MADGDLQALENELRECLQRQHFSEALDIYDEIEAAGGMKAQHWIGRGDCLLKLRRKQDARSAWLRALESDPTSKGARDLLDQNFPGWKPMPLGGAEGPMTPMPVRNPSLAPPTAVPVERPVSSPGFSASPYVDMAKNLAATSRMEAITPEVPPAPGGLSQGSGPAPVVVNINVNPAVGGGMAAGRINWAYVMEDLAEEQKAAAAAPKGGAPAVAGV